MAAATANLKTKLTKSDLVSIARSRAVAMTTASLRSASVETLTNLLGSITLTELEQVSQQEQARVEYAELNLTQIKDLCRSGGLAVSGSRAELIDRLLGVSGAITQTNQLDPSQEAILQDYLEPLLVINAGPGSGKTTTLAKLASKIANAASKVANTVTDGVSQQSRILVLMYNRNARAAFRDKLKANNTKVAPKTKLLELNGTPGATAGLFVVTFDEYIHHCRLVPHGMGGFNNSSYRGNFETGLALKPHFKETYDYILIDEAQDLLPNHAALIEQLWTRTKHLVIAGDPRQEIYVGAGWFSFLWLQTEERFRRTLKYNHRASPQLVDLINRYSAKHFPSLHYQQIASRVNTTSQADDPGDKAELISYLLLHHDQVASYLAPVMLAGSSSAYCIAPVTIEKFNTATIVTELRQNLYELKPGVTFHSNSAEEGDALSPGLAMGNSYTYKGTERSAVYVIQSDLPFTDYGISAVMVQKLVYVAISRARDHLTIVLSHKPGPSELWYGLIPAELQVNQVKATKLTKPQEFLNVSEDLARLECWGGANSTELAVFTPVEVDIQQDSDFVGILVETHLATALGVSSDYGYVFKSARIQTGKLIDPVGIFVNEITKTYEVTFDPTKSLGQDANVALLNALIKLQDSAVNHPEYTRAVIKMSANIGKVWTVSERLVDFKPDLAETAEVVKTILNKFTLTAAVPQHGQKLLSEIYCHRSATRVGAVVGETDFTWPGVDNTRPGLVLELKHCAQTETRHINQVRLYQSLLGAGTPTAVLVNTKLGQVLQCPSLDLSYVHDVTRAILALKYACVCSEKLPHRVKAAAKGQVYISVDLEFTLNDSSGANLIYEVGAVAYQPNTDRVLGAFHRIWLGSDALADALADVSATDQVTDSFEQLTGLKRNLNPSTDQLNDQTTIKAEFKTWLDSVTTKPTFVYWGATDHDLTMLGIGHDIIGDKITTNKINAMTTFRAWLDNSGQSRRNNYSLTDAVRQCLNQVPFQAHRAYEDAVLTAAVLTAITNGDTAV